MLSDKLWFDPAQVFIGGRWTAPFNGDGLPIEDPSTGSEIGLLAKGGTEDIDAAVAAAQSARLGDWGRMTATDRGRSEPGSRSGGTDPGRRGQHRS